jgi:hypothetical protein
MSSVTCCPVAAGIRLFIIFYESLRDQLVKRAPPPGMVFSEIAIILC